MNKVKSALLLFQYCSAIVLVVCSITIHRQLNLIESKDLGFRNKNVLVVYTPPVSEDGSDQKLEALKTKMLPFTAFANVTLSSDVPGKIVGFGMGNSLSSDPTKTTKMCEMVRIDPAFLPTYNIQLISGRNFREEDASDSTENIILTETTAKLFGLSNSADAVNEFINLEGHGNKKFRIIGVTRDYHHQSLREQFRPVVFLMYNPWKAINYKYVSIQLADEQDAHQAIESAKKAFSEIFPASTFTHFFLDDFYNKQYEGDKQFRNYTVSFTAIVIIIVCLGLLGLSGLMLVRRQKEIGIRKVLGATAVDILATLNKDYLKVMVLSIILAVPLSTFLMDGWLRHFAYRVHVEIDTYFLAVILTGGLTIIIVCLHALKHVRKSPTIAMRNE